MYAKKYWYLLASSAAFSMFHSGVAIAQTADTSVNSEANVSKPESGGLEEIVVTAQRRSENLQNVPIAVAVATASELTARGVTGVDSLKLAAPGVEVQSNIGYALPIIRGLGSVGSGAGIEPPIAFYVDGVYYGAALSSIFSFNNIERVEVLKGPQGTLFGRNATGGLIQIVTRDPAQKLGMEANLSFGNYQTFRGSAYITGPITNNLSADLAVQGSHMGEGYGKNLVSGQDVNQVDHDVAIRSKWLWKLDSTTFRLTGDYADVAGSVNGQRTVAGTSTPPPFQSIYGGGPYDIAANQEPYLRIKSGGVSLKIDHEFDNVQLVSITAYRKTSYNGSWDFDYGPVLARSASILQKDKQFSQETQLLSKGDGPLKWVIGNYYYNADAAYRPTNILRYYGAAVPPLGNQIWSGSNTSTQSIAGFAQATYRLFDQLSFTGGLRYTHERRELQDAYSYFIRPNGTVNTVAGYTSGFNAGTTVNRLTWRMSVDYKPSQDLLLYASYNRGFKSGGFNPTALAVPPYRPEKIDAYETGFKSTLLDRMLRFNGAFYYYNYRDVQVKIPVATGTANYNGASAEIYGADLDLEARPTPDLKLKLGYQYTHGKYKSFPNALIATMAAGGYYTVLPGNAAGNRTPLAPLHSLSASASYDIAVSESKVTLNGSYYYNSGYFTEPDNVLKQKAYSLFTASVKWVAPDEHFSVTLWGQNLSDARVASVLGMQLTTQSAPYNALARVAYAPPRTYGVTLGFKY